MHKSEVGLVVFAALGLVASVVWIATTRAGGSAARAAAPTASIRRLTPLSGGAGPVTDGAQLVNPTILLPGPTYDISGRVISKVNVGSKKLIAITFDDGPSRSLHKILKTLTKNDSVATFFIVSDYIAKHGPWVSDVITQGSEVGNHTATHAQLDQASVEVIGSELDKSQEVIGQILGQKPTLMRPPVGKYNQQVIEAARKRKLGIALWSIHSQDTGNGSAREIAGRVIASASPGDIILMHEAGAHSAEALPLILSSLRAKGYTFVTVSQLLAAGNLP